MGAHPSRGDEAAEAAYFALFKVISVADLAGAEKAVDWARWALENEAFLPAFAEATRRRTALAPDAPGEG
jgi:hypothetical protein